MLSNEEMLNVRGGGVTATLLNSISRLVETVLNLGQIVGSSIRRSLSKKACKIS